MKMKQKLISLVMSVAMAVSAAAIPMLAGAEAYVNQDAIYINNSDFSDVSSKVPGLPIQMNGQPWLFKGSSGTHTETYMQEDGLNFCRFVSDNVKGGVAGEGSWYFYNRNEKKTMDDQGYVKFDIRISKESGPFSLDMGDFTDPTKGTSNLAAKVSFDPGTKKITAQTSAERREDVYDSLATDTWYTVELEVNVKLQEYTVTIYDKAGKQLGQAKELAFVQKACEAIKTTCFSYTRKNTLGHAFDLTNVTISRLSKEDTVATQKATPTATPTPSATPSPTPSTAPTATPAPSAKPVNFTDIATHWAKDDITKMAQAGVINGMTDTTFAPDQQITRSQFIKLVVATLGLDTTAAYTGTASDVKDHWAANYIQAAEKANLIDANFVTDGKMMLDQNITREEMASLITRAAKSKSVDAAGGSVDSFSDKDAISAWAKDDVAGAVKLGIVKGMDDGSFSPKAEATRAQAAVMMSRLLDQIK